MNHLKSVANALAGGGVPGKWNKGQGSAAELNIPFH